MQALVILHPGFEEIEAVTPVDLLARAGISIVTAAVGPNLCVKGRSGISIRAETTLDDASKKDFDVVILPGGPGISKLRNHPLICELFKRQNSANRWIACICAAPLLLHDAGLILPDLHYTCHPSAEKELPGKAEDLTTVSAHRMLTSQGAGTSIDFALAIIAELCGDSVANTVAASICYKTS